MSSSSRSATSRTGSASPSSCSNSPGLTSDRLGARLAGALLGRLGEVVPGEQPFGPGVLEVVLDLAALEQHVHRHDRAARAQDAEVDDREVGDVRQHDPDTVAGLEAFRLQQPGHPRCALVHGLPVDLGVVELVGDAVREPLCGLGDDAGQVGAHLQVSSSVAAVCLPSFPYGATPWGAPQRGVRLAGWRVRMSSSRVGVRWRRPGAATSTSWSPSRSAWRRRCSSSRCTRSGSRSPSSGSASRSWRRRSWPSAGWPASSAGGPRSRSARPFPRATCSRTAAACSAGSTPRSATRPRGRTCCG